MVAKGFTETAWLQELQRAATSLPERNGFLTTREMVEATGMSVGTLRERLYVLWREGRVLSHRVSITAISGEIRHVPAFKIVAEKHKE